MTELTLQPKLLTQYCLLVSPDLLIFQEKSEVWNFYSYFPILKCWQFIHIEKPNKKHCRPVKTGMKGCFGLYGFSLTRPGAAYGPTLKILVLKCWMDAAIISSSASLSCSTIKYSKIMPYVSSACCSYKVLSYTLFDFSKSLN